MNLERLKGDFDRIRLLDYDALVDLYGGFAPYSDPDGHWLLYTKRDPELGLGGLLVPIPEPAVFEDDTMAECLLKMVNEEWAYQRGQYERR